MWKIKIFYEGQAGASDTVNIPRPLQTISAFIHSPIRCFRRDSLMTPTTPLQTSFTVTPSIQHFCPPPPIKKKIGSYTIRGLPNCLFRPLLSSLFEKTSHHVPFLRRSTGWSHTEKNLWMLLDSVAPQGATLSNYVASGSSNKWPLLISFKPVVNYFNP